MSKRLLGLGLVAAAVQLFASGCHPVARWRANHPCAECNGPFDRIHARRAVVGEPVVGPVVGTPVASSPACHGCAGGGAPGIPVSYGPGPGDVVPITHPPAGYPNISYPVPITPGGPTVVPQYELPTPMPVPPAKPGN